MLDIQELITRLMQQFPTAVIKEEGDAVVVMTIHGIGNTVKNAIANALKLQQEMKDDGQSIRQMLDDVHDDLRTPGMSRVRHDSLIELLDIASNAVNGAVVSGVITWIQVPGINREIEDLRRRIDTRLNMVALDMQAREKAQQQAGTQADKHKLDPAITLKWEDEQQDAPPTARGLIALNQARLGITK